jgi:PAS domain S-box-containing protein
MLGYAPRRSSASPRRALFLTDDIEPTFEAFAMALASSGGTETRELTYVRKDGTHIRVSQTLTTERGADGRVVGYLGVATDVTQQVRAQSALVAERDFTSAVLDTAGSLVIVTDREARIERFNRAAEEVTGFKARDMIGKSLIETLMPPESVEGVRAELAAAVAPEFPRHYEHGLLTAGRRHAPGGVDRGLPHRRPGEITHLVATGTDVTETRRAADALRHLHRLAGGHPRAHHDAHHGQGRRGALPAGQPGVAGGERRPRPDREHGLRALRRPRGRRARAADGPPGVEHGHPGRVRAHAGRLDRARRQVPPARRRRRDLRRRLGRDRHLRAQPRARQARAAPRRSRTSWPT